LALVTLLSVLEATEVGLEFSLDAQESLNTGVYQSSVATTGDSGASVQAYKVPLKDMDRKPGATLCSILGDAGIMAGQHFRLVYEGMQACRCAGMVEHEHAPPAACPTLFRGLLDKSEYYCNNK